MITSIRSTNLNYKSVNFSGLKQETQPEFCTVEKFISGVNEETKKAEKGSILNRAFWSVTALLVGSIIPLGYGIISIVKSKKYKNCGDKLKLEKQHKNFDKFYKWTILAGFGIMQGLQILFNKQTDKNFKKLNDKFNKMNTDTSAKLDNNMFRSFYIGGIYNFGSDKIQINQDMLNDPYCRTFILNKIIKHELTHAKQAELIARSKDGIKKLNYAVINLAMQSVKSNTEVKAEFLQINKELENDNGKYANQKITLNGLNVNLKNFVKAICICINNDNVTYEDLPIIIDRKHYQEIIETQGILTPNEEKLADKYYNDLLNYPAINFMNAFNPFGKYRKNGLEKEAFKKGK